MKIYTKILLDKDNNLIEEKYKDSIKSRQSNTTNTLRLIKSAIKDKDIASRSNNNNQEIKDEEILSLLQTLIKQRKDSIESFKSASRDDLIIIEQTEINIILIKFFMIINFLPDKYYIYILLILFHNYFGF